MHETSVFVGLLIYFMHDTDSVESYKTISDEIFQWEFFDC